MCKHKYIIPEHERSASTYLFIITQATYSHVLVQARAGRGRRENKIRNIEVVWYLLHTNFTYVMRDTASRTESLQLRRVG